MKRTIAEIHEFQSKALCQFCGGNAKKECVTVSFKAGLLKEAVLCVKCMRNALRVDSLAKPSRQPSSELGDDSGSIASPVRDGNQPSS